MQIEPLTEEHLVQAAALGAAHLRELANTLPLLPTRYTRVETLLALLRPAAEQGRGVVALQDGDLLGYMADQRFGYKEQQAAMSPAWAHATVEQDARRIQEALYTAMSRRWLSGRCALHLMAWTPNDLVGQETWFWQGFGLMAVDAVRGLAPLENAACAATIRQATADDVEELLALDGALTDHLAAAPVYRWGQPATLEKWRTELGHSDLAGTIWLAKDGAVPLGYMGISADSHHGCDLVMDPGTAAINGAYLAPEARGQGIADALLDACLSWARQQGGLERCAVDFESANAPGARFWLRHFQPIVYTGMRFVDMRVRALPVNWQR